MIERVLSACPFCCKTIWLGRGFKSSCARLLRPGIGCGAVLDTVASSIILLEDAPLKHLRHICCHGLNFTSTQARSDASL
jgi:hypothetical protein